MKTLNAVEIDEKIKEGISAVKSADDLRILQKWAKEAKKKKVIEPTVTSFRRIYYTWYSKVRSSGSGRVCGEKLNKVDYTSFIFLGIEIRLPDTIHCFDERFDKKDIWIDRFIKYGGTEYFPKQTIKIFSGINLEQYFFDYLIEKDFFILKKGGEKYYLLNSKTNCIKILTSRRLTKYDTCNNPVIKIAKEHVGYLKLPVRDWDFFYNN